jgi:hypothetical protein
MYLVVLFLLDIGKRRSRERRRMIGMRSNDDRERGEAGRGGEERTITKKIFRNAHLIPIK